MTKNISVLGSTGSIGTQTLEVVRRLGNIQIKGLTAGSNIDLLEEQIREFKPLKVAVMDKKKAEELKFRVRDTFVEVFYGIDGLVEIATMDEIDTVVTSVVGNVGLKPTIEAIRNGKNIALANKETLVSAGEIVMKEAKKYNINIYPVDSEHSAIFQCLQGNEKNNISRILLTASGGPFRGKSKDELKDVTIEDALNHPNWSMGKKITIDSATMMNKGLEMIEAKWLFNVEMDDIEVLVHPQSVVHSAVEFEDGAIIAQMGEPDMKVPIQYALTYPKRIKANFPKVDFKTRSNLTFETPDTNVFECLGLAYKAAKIGGTMPAVMNAANEIAVEKFLNKEIKFLDIPKLIEKTMDAYNVKHDFSLEDIFEADNWARQYAMKLK